MGSSVNWENTECKYQVSLSRSRSRSLSLSLALSLSLSSPLTLGIVGSYVTDGNFHQFPYTTDSLFAQAGTFTSILFIGVIAMPFLFQYLNSNENKQQSAVIFAAQNCKDLNYSMKIYVEFSK